MEFHQLRCFVAAAEELSVTAAAKRLRISQPALSRQIALLEEELGVALFDRIRQRIHLTDAGRFFLPKARQILCDAETGAQQVSERYGTAQRTIRLGFLTVFLDDIVTPAVKALKKESSRVQVSLFELSPRAQLDRLRNDELDLALVGNLDAEDRERFTTRSIMRSRMAAVLPDDHRLAGRKQLSLRELSGEAFVSLSDAIFPGRRQFLREICQSQGFDPSIVEESDSLSLMLGAVSSGTGVALLPSHSRKLPHAGCVFVRLKTPVVYAETMAVFLGNPEAQPRASLLAQLHAVAEKIGED